MADIIFSALDADIESVIGRLGEISKAQKDLDAYVQDLIIKRSSAPEDDLLTELVQSHYNEDRLSHDELSAMVEAILLAGTDTTRNQLGATIAVLADHPDQYQALRNDPSLIPAAIEESLRYISAVRTTGRLATTDQVIDGILFLLDQLYFWGFTQEAFLKQKNRASSSISLGKVAASFSFGSGAHHCLGASLARAELQEELGSFVQKFSSYELVSPVEWKPLSMGIWGPAKLEIKILADGESDQSQNQTSFKTTVKVESKLEDNESSEIVNQWIREADETRRTLRLSIPDLIRKPKFPPLIRLLVTVFRFGKAFMMWKIRDRKAEGSGRQELLYERLRHVAELQGPTYVKLAQLISAAEGVFPEALVAECKKCRDQVSPEPWEDISKVLNDELGNRRSEIVSVNQVPIAAASIAQVHEAVLSNGSDVVIKIQRPGIRKSYRRSKSNGWVLQNV